MKCVHCGANIPDDQMICPVCGAEVQIVPDYNPLDDVLAREVRGSVEGATRQIRTRWSVFAQTGEKVQIILKEIRQNCADNVKPGSKNVWKRRKERGEGFCLHWRQLLY